MAQLSLANNRGIVTLDDADLPLVQGHRWYLSTTNSLEYAVGLIGPKMLSMHRFILKLTKDDLRVDHVDGNGLNNCRDNLRLASVSQNNANSGSRGGTSKYKGVSFFKGGTRQKRWIAQITVDGHSKNLGYFLTQEEAALAYDQAARLAWGNYAYLNFP